MQHVISLVFQRKHEHWRGKCNNKMEENVVGRLSDVKAETLKMSIRTLTWKKEIHLADMDMEIKKDFFHEEFF